VTDPAIGLIGLGLMGSALADRLVGAGQRVIGWDIEDERRGALRERGGEVAHAAQEVFSGCSRVLLSLPSHREVGDVVRAAGTTLSRGLTIIDTTTGDPASTEALARTMDEQGIVYLDATISGSSAQVRAGAATLMVGGDAESFAACSDIFALTSGATRRGSSTRRSSPNPRSCKDAWSSQRGTGSSPRTRHRSPHSSRASKSPPGAITHSL
jgi:3-hydroxyisobutyrate dehydrogenase-like beta-hydroxyacid dehydrogenase